MKHDILKIKGRLVECTERGRVEEIGIAPRATTACRAYAGLRISLTRPHQFFLQEQHYTDGKGKACGGPSTHRYGHIQRRFVQSLSFHPAILSKLFNATNSSNNIAS